MSNVIKKTELIRRDIHSATIKYVVFGFTFLIIGMVGGVPNLASILDGDFQRYEYVNLAIFIATSFLGLDFVNIYNRRQEFNLYYIETKGNINFDNINRDFKQVKYINNKIYLIREDEYIYYKDYRKLNDWKIR